MLTLKVAETWPVCTVCNGWVMLLVSMGKTHFGGIIWGEVVMMHAQKFPISMYFSASLPIFRKGVLCTKTLHPLTRAVQCAVRFSTLFDSVPLSFLVRAALYARIPEHNGSTLFREVGQR